MRAKPTFSMFTQTKKVLENPYAKSGISVISLPDWRWERRDIKTVQLLYPTMAKTQASQKGADDAWLLEDGFITEASSATAHIVKKDGTLITRDLSHVILPGITRASTLDLAREAGIKVEERPFTLEEAKDAAEAFNTSATNFVLPVVSIDGQKIGDGTPGPITKSCAKSMWRAVWQPLSKTEPQGKMAQGVCKALRHFCFIFKSP